MSRLRRRERRGQTLVEFALILPIFILVLVGIFDMGRAVYAFNTISNSAREGMRTAIVDQNVTAIKDRAAQHATGLVSASDVTVTFTDSTGTAKTTCAQFTTGCKIGWSVTVTVLYDYNAATPVIGNLVGTIKMKSTSQQAIEYVYTSP